MAILLNNTGAGLGVSGKSTTANKNAGLLQSSLNQKIQGVNPTMSYNPSTNTYTIPQGSNIGVQPKTTTPASSQSLISTPKQTTVPTTIQPVQNQNTIQAANIQNQIGDLQSKVNAMTKYGLSDASQLTKSATGEYVPAQAQTAGMTAPTPTTNPYTAVAPTYPGLVGALANISTTPSEEYSAAQKQALNLQNQIAQLQQNYAEKTANIEGSPIDLSLATGQQGILGRQEALKEAALSGQLAGAQQAAQTAIQQRQAAQTGLTSAAGLAAPQQYGITTTPFNPLTGTYGTMPGGTSGAFGAGQVTGNVQLGQQYSQMNAANTQAKGIENTIVNHLQQNPALNPSGLSVINGVLQWGANQMSNPQYKLLADYLNEYAATVAPILGAGGTITDFKTQMAQSLVNGQAKGESIMQTLQGLSRLADDKLANMASAATGGGVVAGGSTAGGNTPGSFFAR